MEGDKCKSFGFQQKRKRVLIADLIYKFHIFIDTIKTMNIIPYSKLTDYNFFTPRNEQI